MPKSFTGPEFIAALAEGALKSPIVRVGMAKQDETDANAILFSENRSCESWIKIPVEIIEKVEHIDNVPCRDHEHPLIRLYIKEPPSDTKEAGILADLLRGAASSRQATAAFGQPTPGAVRTRTPADNPYRFRDNAPNVAMRHSARRRPVSFSPGYPGMEEQFDCLGTCITMLYDCYGWAWDEFDECWCRNTFRSCAGYCTGRHSPYEWCPPPGW